MDNECPTVRLPRYNMRQTFVIDLFKQKVQHRREIFTLGSTGTFRGPLHISFCSLTQS
jgi:hypothetical protein